MNTATKTLSLMALYCAAAGSGTGAAASRGARHGATRGAEHPPTGRRAQSEAGDPRADTSNEPATPPTPQRPGNVPSA